VRSSAHADWGMSIEHRVDTIERLKELYRQPAERAASKVFSRIDSSSSRFIEHVTFAILATSNRAGSVDASPRGGPAGFIRQLDDNRVAVPDLVGNNRLDSFRNIIDNPVAGLLLVVPGKEETLRINGMAYLTTDPEVLDGFVDLLRRPKMAVIVHTDELFGHCAKAFRRGHVWDHAWWSTGEAAPDLAEIYSCQFDNVEADAMRAIVEQIYSTDLAEDQPEARPDRPQHDQNGKAQTPTD
jgi:uncharacterized protein